LLSVCSSPGTKFIVIKDIYDYTLDSHFGQVEKDT